MVHPQSLAHSHCQFNPFLSSTQESLSKKWVNYWKNLFSLIFWNIFITKKSDERIWNDRKKFKELFIVSSIEYRWTLTFTHWYEHVLRMKTIEWKPKTFYWIDDDLSRLEVERNNDPNQRTSIEFKKKFRFWPWSLMNFSSTTKKHELILDNVHRTFAIALWMTLVHRVDENFYPRKKNESTTKNFFRLAFWSRVSSVQQPKLNATTNNLPSFDNGNENTVAPVPVDNASLSSANTDESKKSTDFLIQWNSYVVISTKNDLFDTMWSKYWFILEIVFQ